MAKQREFIPDCADCQREKPITFYVVLVRVSPKRITIWMHAGIFIKRREANDLAIKAKEFFGWAKVVKCEVRA